MRACRTDKGVRVAAQLVSFKMILTAEDEENKQKAIQSLKEQHRESIKVNGFTRISAGFHAQKTCDSRIHEYLFPTYILNEISKDSFYSLKKNEGESQDTAQVSQYRISSTQLDSLKSLLSHHVASKNFFNFTLESHSVILLQLDTSSLL